MATSRARCGVRFGPMSCLADGGDSGDGPIVMLAELDSGQQRSGSAASSWPTGAPFPPDDPDASENLWRTALAKS